MSAPRDYTEHNEHELIQTHVASRGIGFFVDIGANNGITGSNTRALWEAGWTGILVEPSANAFQSLCENYRSRERVTLINAAVTPLLNITELVFYEHMTIPACGWNSMHKPWVDQWNAPDGKNPFQQVIVPARHITQLPLAKQIDFLSIDTEGSDYDILASMPETMRPRAIMAEMDKFDNRKKITDLLNERGYVRVGGTEYNDLFVC